MSDLQLSLILLGVIGVLGTYAFNRWQERKYRKQADKMFSGTRQDVLFDEPPSTRTQSAPSRAERIEPSLAAGAPPEAAQSTAAQARVSSAYSATNDEDATAPAAAAAPSRAGATSSRQPQPAAPLRPSYPPHSIGQSPATSLAQPARTGLINQDIDLVGVIRSAVPVSYQGVQSLQARAQTFGKTTQWEGLENGQWQEIAVGNSYNELRVGLQLADRRGPLYAADISRFISLIKQFAVELGGSAQCEAESSAVGRASEMDAFCADVDVEIGVNLVAQGSVAFAATKVRALAEAAGLRLEAEGVFHCYDEHGVSLFTLRNSEPRPFLLDQVRYITTHGITLLLDVPRVAHGVQVFDQMLTLARHIAVTLGGEVVDDNRKPLTDAGADSIRRSLGLIYRQMDGFGITAGSALALRLFS